MKAVQHNKKNKEKVNGFCKHHKPMNKKLGYVAWFDWADEMEKKGEKQTLCPDCNRFLYPCEIGEKKEN